jgi:hypothetical protein
MMMMMMMMLMMLMLMMMMMCVCVCVCVWVSGVGRKMNYTGDLIVALCHGLPAGFTAIMPHLYFAYLFALLVHRCMR